MNPKLRIAVVGATGVVGREILGGLQELGHPASQLTALASERSEGEEVEYLDDSLEVEKADLDSFRGVNLALLAVPAAQAKMFAGAAQSAGAWVVDTSPAYRAQPEIPLALPGVNEAALDAPFKGRIVRVPSAPTAALAFAVNPLRQTFGVSQVHVAALLGASSQGTRGIAELERQTADLLSGRDPEAAAFPNRLGFNLIPQVGEFDGPWTSEELAVQAEAQQLWAGQGPAISTTALYAPTFYGCCLTVTAKLGRQASVEQLHAAWKGSATVKVLDVPAEKIYPMPMLVTADPAVHVGRVRLVPGAPEWVSFVVAMDNAGRGAALNALEVGARLAQKSA
jgi:aspartate-semialdehyde dehydrogenase